MATHVPWSRLALRAEEGRTGGPGVCPPGPALGREAWPCPSLSGGHHQTTLLL